MNWNNWILIVIGVWSVLAPWILGFSGLNLVSWNSIMIGGLIVIFALWDYDSEK
ncbi:MAG: SPW repeat protein [Candidatus Paceibacterota bacterium]